MGWEPFEEGFEVSEFPLERRGDLLIVSLEPKDLVFDVSRNLAPTWWFVGSRSVGYPPYRSWGMPAAEPRANWHGASARVKTGHTGMYSPLATPKR